ncbi:MAG: histidine kinase [Propionicimonas sp.]|uniref:sensor histidine kinase n=1 Tax=Propionicimonas sp. TaxID=1955623 RepID=UPI002B1FA07C|nr:histidine kinase [Propionicimonas sp.]MEA4944608.1 histidine kinase [Propionicimonas sp.]
MGHRATTSTLRAAGAQLLSAGLLEVLLAAAVFLLSRLERPSDTAVPLVLDLVVAVGAASSGRWLVPGAVVAGIGVTGWLFVPWERPTFGLIAVLVPLFAAVARGRLRLAVVILCWYLPVALLTIAHWSTSGVAGIVFNTGFVVVVFGITWATGLLIHRLSAHLEKVTGEYQQRLVDQRLDLARDLHDTLAQTITAMVVTTEGIKLQLDDSATPEVAEDLETVLRLGRQSITDLRGMLGVLRSSEPDGQLVSAWRVTSIPHVLAQQSADLERQGFTVSTLVEGDPDVLPPSVRECVAKLVVEATSNMAKHATAGGHCSLMLGIEEDAVEAVFSNPFDQDAPADPQGLGLVGATERVMALGGKLTVLTSGGQWVLQARLPIAGRDEVVSR